MKENKAENNKNNSEKKESYNISINEPIYKFIEEEEIVQEDKGNVDLTNLIKQENEQIEEYDIDENIDNIAENEEFKNKNQYLNNNNTNVIQEIKIDKESLTFLKNIKVKKDRKISIMIKEKIKIVDILKYYKISHYKMEEMSGISPQNQRYWIKTYDKMKAQIKQNKISCKGQGAKSAFFKYENEIINFIYENRKYNIAVTTFMVISKIISLYKDFNLKPKHAQLLNVYKFLKRHNL